MTSATTSEVCYFQPVFLIELIHSDFYFKGWASSCGRSSLTLVKVSGLWPQEN